MKTTNKEKELKKIRDKITKKQIEKKKIDIEILELVVRAKKIMVTMKAKSSYDKIGKVIGISRQRVHQIISKKLTK